MGQGVDKFRLLIILSVSMWLCATYVSFNVAPPPAELQSLYDWRGYGEVVPGIVSARWYWVETASTLGGLIGMFFFIPAARTAILAITLLNPLRTGLGGVWVSSPLEDCFWALYWVFFMFAIGMAFFDITITSKFATAKEPPVAEHDSEQAVAADRGERRRSG